MSEVSSTRLYLGNLPRTGTPALMSSMKFLHQSSDPPPGLSILQWRDLCITLGSGTLVQADSSLLQISASKQDIEDHFGTHGTGKITDIKIMNGFGFIEYEDAMDARDIVPG
jgi:RNA recognition motif-containing protein